MLATYIKLDCTDDFLVLCTSNAEFTLNTAADVHTRNRKYIKLQIAYLACNIRIVEQL